jgi:hypothetical protein
LRLAGEGDDLPGLERAHLLRLMLVLALAVLLSGAALQARIPLSFEWVVVLVLVGVWGLERMISQLLH